MGSWLYIPESTALLWRELENQLAIGTLCAPSHQLSVARGQTHPVGGRLGQYWVGSCPYNAAGNPQEVHHQLEKEFPMEEVNNLTRECLCEHAAEVADRNYELLQEAVRDANRCQELTI